MPTKKPTPRRRQTDSAPAEATAAPGVHMSQVAYTWQHPAYDQHHKSIRWHVFSAVILVAAVAWAVLPGRWFGDGNYLFATFLVLFYLVVLLLDHRPVEMIETTLTYDGVKHGGHFYWYRDMAEFFVIYEDEGTQKLYFEFKNPIRPRLGLPLGGQNAVAIRDFLLQFVPENLERETEPISDRLHRWLKL